jgi:hypothetical protein
VPDDAALYPVSRQHLEVMSDGIGIMQHSIGSQPDPAHGYCVDDVARALEVDLLHGRTLGWAAVRKSAWRASTFLTEAFDSASGRFRNFRSVDGSWIGGLGSEDSQGRALLALGEVVALAPDGPLVDAAHDLFLRALPATRRFVYPRAEASVVLGCAAVLDVAPGGDPAATIELLSGRILHRFQLRGTAGWPWLEDTLTYENAVLPRALIVAGRTVGNNAMTEVGLAALDWLIEVQTSPDGHLSPIGNGWWPRYGERSRFDQQPIEATALLRAAASAWDMTGSHRYRAAMERSYAWFLGANDLGLRLADPDRGACRDGLTRRGVNMNEGAESTLMWLIAAERIRALRGADVPAATRPEFAMSTR